LQERTDALKQLQTILTANRAGRFAIAAQWTETRGERAETNRVISARLNWWLTYWRDALLLCEGSTEIANIDQRSALAGLIERITRVDALNALRATRVMLETLATSANTRLALEAMLLDYPGLRR
jgi:hypothetical protein